MRLPHAVIILLATLPTLTLAQAPSSTAPVRVTPPDFAGRWVGVLENFPARTGAARVDVEREIGPWPAADSICTALRTVYREGGVVRGEKAYRLCRGRGADDLYVDEGDGLHLPSRLIGGVLVSPFKYDSTLLVSTLRRRGALLEEEILTVPDRPAGSGVVGLQARGIQRLTLRRVGRARARTR